MTTLYRTGRDVEGRQYATTDVTGKNNSRPQIERTNRTGSDVPGTASVRSEDCSAPDMSGKDAARRHVQSGDVPTGYVTGLDPTV